MPGWGPSNWRVLRWLGSFIWRRASDDSFVVVVDGVPIADPDPEQPPDEQPDEDGYEEWVRMDAVSNAPSTFEQVGPGLEEMRRDLERYQELLAEKNIELEQVKEENEALHDQIQDLSMDEGLARSELEGVEKKCQELRSQLDTTANRMASEARRSSVTRFTIDDELVKKEMALEEQMRDTNGPKVLKTQKIFGEIVVLREELRLKNSQLKAAERKLAGTVEVGSWATTRATRAEHDLKFSKGLGKDRLLELQVLEKRIAELEAQLSQQEVSPPDITETDEIHRMLADVEMEGFLHVSIAQDRGEMAQASIVDRVGKLIQRIEHLNAEKEKLKKENDELKKISYTKEDAYIVQIEALEDQAKEQTARMAELNAASSTMLLEKDSLEQQLMEQKAKLIATIQGSAYKDTQIESLESEIAELEIQNTQLSGKTSTQDVQMAQTAQQLAESKETVKILYKKIKGNEENIDGYSDKLVKLEEKLEFTKERFMKQQETFESDAVLQEARSRLGAQRLEEAGREIREISQQLVQRDLAEQELKQKIQELRTELEEALKQSAAMLCELDQKREELALAAADLQLSAELGVALLEQTNQQNTNQDGGEVTTPADESDSDGSPEAQTKAEGAPKGTGAAKLSSNILPVVVCDKFDYEQSATDEDSSQAEYLLQKYYGLSLEDLENFPRMFATCLQKWLHNICDIFQPQKLEESFKISDTPPPAQSYYEVDDETFAHELVARFELEGKHLPPMGLIHDGGSGSGIAE